MSSSPGRSSTKAITGENVIQTHPNREPEAGNADNGAFTFKSQDTPSSYLATSAQGDSTNVQLLESLSPKIQYVLKPSFKFSETAMSLQVFEHDSSSRKYSSLTTSTTFRVFDYVHNDQHSSVIAGKQPILDTSQNPGKQLILNTIKNPGKQFIRDNILNLMDISETDGLADSSGTINVDISPCTRKSSSNTPISSTDTSVHIQSPRSFIPYPGLAPHQAELSATFVLSLYASAISSTRTEQPDSFEQLQEQTTDTHRPPSTATSLPELYNRNTTTETVPMGTGFPLQSSSQFFMASPLIPTDNTSPMIVLVNKSPLVLSSRSNDNSLSPSTPSEEIKTYLATSCCSPLLPTDSDTNNFISTNTEPILVTVSADQISAKHIHTDDTPSAYSHASSSRSLVDISHEPEFTTNIDLYTFPNLSWLLSAATISPNENNSSSAVSTGYFPYTSTFYTFVNESTDNFNSSGTLDATTGPYLSDNVIPSKVVLTTASSSALVNGYQATPADTKEWAIPVTGALSAGLIVAVIAIIAICCRAQRGRLRHCRDEDSGETALTKQKQWHRTETNLKSLPEVNPNHERHTDRKVVEKPGPDQNWNIVEEPVKPTPRKLRTKPTGASGGNACRNSLEMNAMSRQSAENNVYVQHKLRSFQGQYSTQNEESVYDDPDCGVDNREEQYRSIEIISKSRWSNNQPDSQDSSHRFSEKTSMSQFSVHQSDNLNTRHGFSETFHRSSLHGRDSDSQKTSHTQYKPFNTSNQAPRNHRMVTATRIPGSDQNTATIASSGSHVRYKIQHHLDLRGALQPGSRCVNEDALDGDIKEHVSFNSHATKYRQVERDLTRIISIANSVQENVNFENIESTNTRQLNPEAAPRGKVENRQGASKYSSYDDTCIRMTEKKTGAYSKNKSPTRKISTMSESAMTQLIVPQDGFMSMGSVYETVNDLSEIGTVPGSSRSFFGSSFDDINLLGTNKEDVDRRLETSENASEDTRKRSSGRKDVEKSCVNYGNNDDETHERKYSGDYIFPIMRKAKLKILEERKLKKLVKKTSIGDNKEQETGQHGWGILGGNKNDIHNGEFKMAMSKPSSVQLTTGTTVELTSPLEEISYTSNIPKIVLTKEEGETTAERPPRVRRKARANNPFLIEVDSPSASERVRRSSAPSMTPSLEPQPSVALSDGMTRSVSSDHLLRYHRTSTYDLNSPRSVSSELLSLVLHSKSDNYSNNERLKKMIDDKYDALFGKKYSYPAPSVKADSCSSQRDVPPRIYTLLARTGKSPLSYEGQKNEDFAIVTDNDEAVAKMNTTLEVRKSDQRHKYGMTSTSLDDDSRPNWHYPGSQSKIQKATRSYVGHVAELKNNDFDPHTIPELDDLNAVNITLSTRPSPRPTLAHGKDGLDWVIKRRNGNLPRLPDCTSNHINQPNQLQTSSPIQNNKLRRSQAHWEAFDDTLQVETLALDNKRTSDAAFMSNNTRTSANMSGPHSHETFTIGERLGEHFKEAERVVDKRENEDGLNTAKNSFDISKEYNSTAVSSDGRSPSHKWANSDQGSKERFEDNFLTAFDNRGPQAQLIEHTHINTHVHSNGLGRAHGEKQQNEDSAKQTSPVRPPRNARRRTKRLKLKRPGSPYLRGQRTETNPLPLTSQNEASFLGEHGIGIQTKAIEEKSKINNNSSRLLSANRISSVDTTTSVVFPLDRSQKRSFSLNEAEGTQNPRPMRAVTLETDQPTLHSPGLEDWSRLFSKAQARFLSSANNTVLQHDSWQDVLNDSDSFTDSEMELYFGASVASANVPPHRSEQNELRELIMDDNGDSDLKISVV